MDRFTPAKFLRIFSEDSALEFGGRFDGRRKSFVQAFDTLMYGVSHRQRLLNVVDLRLNHLDAVVHNFPLSVLSALLARGVLG